MLEILFIAVVFIKRMFKPTVPQSAHKDKVVSISTRLEYSGSKSLGCLAQETRVSSLNFILFPKITSNT
jgi:hypothetical protein